jgi:cell wall-associated NlpC family hydrolase
MAIKLGPLVAIGTGALFVYSGIKGFSILKAAQNVIRGTGPNVGQSTSLLAMPGTQAAGSSGGTSAGGLAGIAQKYVGKLRYVFGGPNAANMGTVDCSSFASKCLAEAGVSNPGGAPYDPRQHGPNTLSYLTWTGATTVGHSASDAQANDLCVWQTHMGICIGGGKMVSARDPAEGVGIDNIAGDIPGEVLFVRRLK